MLSNNYAKEVDVSKNWFEPKRKVHCKETV